MPLIISGVEQRSASLPPGGWTEAIAFARQALSAMECWIGRERVGRDLPSARGPRQPADADQPKPRGQLSRSRGIHLDKVVRSRGRRLPTLVIGTPSSLVISSAILKLQYTAGPTVLTCSRYHRARRCNRQRSDGGSATTVTEKVGTPALAWNSNSTTRGSARFTGIEQAISAQARMGGLQCG